MANYFQDSTLIGFDINLINPSIEKLFQAIDVTTNPKKYRHSSNQLYYYQGDVFQPQHGMIEDAGDSDDEEDKDHHSHHVDYKVAKKLPATGTPWDNVILVPVEASWQIHGMGNGHADEEHEEHHHDNADHDENEEHEEHHHNDADHDGHESIAFGVFDEHDAFKPVSAFIVKPSSVFGHLDPVNFRFIR